LPAIGEFLADMGILNTALDLVPVAGFVDLFLQPVGIVPQSVFFESPIRHDLPGPFVGNHESEDRDAEDEYYYQKHEEQIHPQQQ